MIIDKAVVFLAEFVCCITISSGSLSSHQSGISTLKFTGLYEETDSLQQEITKYQYRGAETCASVCHNNEKAGYQYNVWKNSPHAKAYNILLSKAAKRYARKVSLKENPETSAACLKCHATAGDLDSSFLLTTYKKEDGVTCEACHKHKFDPKTFLPKESDCLECHNGSVHKMSKFNFRKNSIEIVHPMKKNL
jgi:hypothetical protein